LRWWWIVALLVACSTFTSHAAVHAAPAHHADDVEDVVVVGVEDADDALGDDIGPDAGAPPA